MTSRSSSDLAFSDAVKAVQVRRHSRGMFEGLKRPAASGQGSRTT